MNFRVGMKVVCVDAGVFSSNPWKTCDDDLDGLEEGRVYTIRKIDLYYGVLVVWLEEIVRRRRGRTKAGQLAEEAGYRPSRFRPVQHRATDISIFTALLNEKKERVDA